MMFVRSKIDMMAKVGSSSNYDILIAETVISLDLDCCS